MKAQFIILGKDYDGTVFTKEFACKYSSFFKTFFFGLYYFALLVEFGNPDDIPVNKLNKIVTERRMKKLYGSICEVCGLTLNVNDVGQSIKYHSICRQYRKKIITDQQKNELQSQVKQLYGVI